MTQARGKADIFKRTAAEIAAGVTPTDYAYAPGDVRRYGAVLDGVTDDSAAVNIAQSSGHDVLFPKGVCVCGNRSTN